jgi:deoxycytidylate deaminase
MPVEEQPQKDPGSQAEEAHAVSEKARGTTPLDTAYAPELVLGFVAPTGIASDSVREVVADRLNDYGYELEEVRLSHWLGNLAGVNDGDRPDSRIPALQKAGDLVRSRSGHSSALAYVAIREITDSRARWNQDHKVSAETAPIPKHAYVVWSLKHRDEVELLRQIYRSRFFLFSIYQPEETRMAALARSIRVASKSTRSYRSYLPAAEKIVKTDEHEADQFGQDVRNAYPEADFFVDGSSEDDLEKSVRRSIDIIFGAPFATPSKDEYGMYVAHAAGLRSAELGRQVGASIATDLGDIVATGTNEVPTFGGGHYWCEPRDPKSERDNREFTRGFDTSDQTKQLLASEIFTALKESGEISEGANPTNDAVYRALAATGLGDITEFGRAVHGEMSALMDAVRRGVAVSGSTMYVTTFPCHQCSRHIVAAGIRRLVYIYPYAKSRADELHGDSIRTTELNIVDNSRVRYENYLGVAPRLYPLAFTMAERKDETGKALPVLDRTRIPRLPDEGPNGIWDVLGYIDRETKALKTSRAWLIQAETDVVEEMRKKES